MTWFYNLRIANKLVLSFIMVLLLTTILGVFSIGQLGRVNQTTTDISSVWLPAMRTALQMKAALARIRVAELQHILSDNEQDFSLYEKSIETQLQLFKKMDAAYTNLITEDEERAIYPEFKKNFASYLAENIKILKLSRGRLDDDARHMIRGDSTKLYQAMTQQLDRLAEINQVVIVPINGRSRPMHHRASGSLVFCSAVWPWACCWHSGSRQLWPGRSTRLSRWRSASLMAI